MRRVVSKVQEHQSGVWYYSHMEVNSLAELSEPEDYFCLSTNCSGDSERETVQENTEENSLLEVYTLAVSLMRKTQY